MRLAAAVVLQDLAKSLGSVDVVETDLLPIFEFFFRDLDEIRSAVVQNMASLMQCMGPAGRQAISRSLASTFGEFQESNWRFRELIAGYFEREFSVPESCF